MECTGTVRYSTVPVRATSMHFCCTYWYGIHQLASALVSYLLLRTLRRTGTVP